MAPVRIGCEKLATRKIAVTSKVLGWEWGRPRPRVLAIKGRLVTGGAGGHGTERKMIVGGREEISPQ